MIPSLLRSTCAVSVAGALAAAPVAADEIKQHARVRQAITLLEIWLEAQRDFEQVPGLSAAVVHDQDVVWKGRMDSRI